MRSSLKYGAVTGIISSIFLFGFFSLMIWLNEKNGWGMQAGNIRGIGGLLSIPIQAAGIFMAMQNIKKLSGQLTYGQALKTGITVAVTIGIVVSLFSLFYCNFIDPGYAAYMVHDAQKAMVANGETPQQIHEDSVKLSKEFSAGAQVMMALVGQSVVGTILSMILALFVRTKK